MHFVTAVRMLLLSVAFSLYTDDNDDDYMIQ